MSIKVKELIKKLETKDQDADVEFIVVDSNGNLVCVDVENEATNITKLLKLFK
jgi:hypothetical protein